MSSKSLKSLQNHSQQRSLLTEHIIFIHSDNFMPVKPKPHS